MGAQHLILVSRSGRVATGDTTLQQTFDALTSGPNSPTVHAWSCDVADASKTKEMLKMLGVSACGRYIMKVNRRTPNKVK